MARICLVVTNGCAPDPRVERHARWLVECGHEVTIFAWDREHTLDALSERDGYTILRTRTGKARSSASIVRQKKRFLRSLKNSLSHVMNVNKNTCLFTHSIERFQAYMVAPSMPGTFLYFL